MIYPKKDKFLKLSKKYKRITIYKEIFADLLNPIGLLMLLRNYTNVFLLESANIDKTFSRFSFIGVNPSKIIKGISNKVVVEENGKTTSYNKNIIDYLTSHYPETSQHINENFGDFAGGLIGFFGYETVNFMGVLRKPIKILKNIHSVFFEVNRFFVFDNFKNKLYAAICVNASNNPEKAYNQSIQEFDKITKEILSAVSNNFNIKNSKQSIENISLSRESEYSDKEFVDKILSVKEEILKGEAIQVVLSRKYTIFSKINPVSLYRALRKINPSPYMFFIKFGNSVVTGSSPETHLKIKNRIATLKPIAGTYPFKKDKNLEKIKKEILNDEKEISEHLMLLDLARNDLYQGCKIETVEVAKAFSVEDYSHVVHIVSEVKGKLLNNITPFQLFLKTFPAGTVTGAPKVRAMELIDEYEDSTREFYSGCVGYINFNHSLDTCITIRSAFIDNEQIILRAGAGIVADSIPENEKNEVERKLKAMFKAVEIAEKMEDHNVFAY